MIALAINDKIQGDAAVAGKVDYSIFGLSNGVFAPLANGQLPDTSGDLLTAAVLSVVATVTIVNTDEDAVAINLYYKSSGAARRLIPEDLLLEAGYSLHTDGKTFCVISTSGQIQQAGAGGSPMVQHSNEWHDPDTPRMGFKDITLAEIVDALKDGVAGTTCLRSLAGTGAALSAAHSDHTHTLQNDKTKVAIGGTGSGANYPCQRLSTAVSFGEVTIATATETFASGSRAVAVGVLHGVANAPSYVKARLYMGGVLVAESAYLSDTTDNLIILIGIAALVGSQSAILKIYSAGAGNLFTYTLAGAAVYRAGAVGIGSIKV
jgi:hypothetical protein